MASFKSFLSQLGHGIQKVVAVAVPVEQAAAPFLNILAPGVGSAINLAFGVVAATEAKFVAAPSGSGPQKLAESVAILSPAIQQLLAQEGIKTDNTKVIALVNAVVAVLNAIPAQSGTTTA
jgi:hypothetical protein